MRFRGFVGVLLIFMAGGCIRKTAGQAAIESYKTNQILYVVREGLGVYAAQDAGVRPVTNLYAGDPVIYTGRISTNKARMNNGDTILETPLLEIRLPNGRRGWTFAAGLSPDSPITRVKVITVGRGGADFRDIQKAIDEAGEGCTVHIIGGQYEVSEPIEIGGKHDLLIEGDDSHPVEIVSALSYDDVLAFKRCRNVTLRNVRARHRQTANCYGAVVSIDDSENVTVEDCDLNGCGMQGVLINQSKDVTVSGCFIHDNSQCAVALTGDFSGILICNNRIVSNEIALFVNEGSMYFSDEDADTPDLRRFVTMTGNIFGEAGPGYDASVDGGGEGSMDEYTNDDFFGGEAGDDAD